MAAVVLAGCSTEAPGEPVPSGGGGRTTAPTTTGQSQTEPTTTASDPQGAPRVDNPLETAKFRNDPCLSLTRAQATELGVGHPGEEGPAADGKSCLWKNDDGGAVHLFWADNNGLATVYKNNEGDAYFEPIDDVEGYPGVATSKVDRRKDGDCEIWVGTSDSTMFMLGLSQSRGKVGTADPCDVATTVAGKVIETVRKG